MKTLEEQSGKPTLYLGESNKNEEALRLMNEAKISFIVAIGEFNYPYVVYNNLKFEGIKEIESFIPRYKAGRFD